MDFISELSAFAQVLLIDLSLAGDNAIIVGLAAAGLPSEQRKKAILLGIVAATILRIIFAIFTTQLLQIIGLTLAGGLLLVWVSWKMWVELRHTKFGETEAEGNTSDTDGTQGAQSSKKFSKAITQIVVADVSMSLDNVLAVAGAAREHLWVLVAGLAISVVLMGAAASWVARLLHKYKWIGYAGLAVVVYVAIKMTWDGGLEVLEAIQK